MKHKHEIDIGEIIRGKERLRRELAGLPFAEKMAMALELGKLSQVLAEARKEGRLFLKKESASG